MAWERSATLSSNGSHAGADYKAPDPKFSTAKVILRVRWVILAVQGFFRTGVRPYRTQRRASSTRITNAEAVPRGGDRE